MNYAKTNKSSAPAFQFLLLAWFLKDTFHATTDNICQNEQKACRRLKSAISARSVNPTFLETSMLALGFGFVLSLFLWACGFFWAILTNLFRSAACGD